MLTGHAIPPYTGGLTNQFAYKGFDFSFNLFFALGHSALNLRDQQRYDFATLDNIQSLQSVKEIFFWTIILYTIRKAVFILTVQNRICSLKSCHT